jgi:hypothetical protein
MDSNDDVTKLSKKEYYKKYQNEHRYKIREINRRFYQNKISDANFKLELNKKTLQNRHNRLIRNGLEIKPRGRPRGRPQK